MALGLIEVFGFTTAVVVGDAVAKAGNVRIVALDRNKPAAGDAAKVPLVMMVKFEGGVAEVEAALEAGVAEAKKRDLYITSYVITRPEDSTMELAKINALGRDKLNAPQNLTAENRESLFQVYTVHTPNRRMKRSNGI